MITTTKQEILKAVIEALEERKRVELDWDGNAIRVVDSDNFPSVADLVAETLEGEG